MLDVKAMFSDGTAQTTEEVKTEPVVETEAKQEQPEVVAETKEEPKEVDSTEKSAPADSLKKAMSVPVSKYVEKKHELKSEKDAREQLEQEVKKLKEQLESKDENKLDISKYLEGIQGDDLIDGDKIKTVLSSALPDIASQAFKAGQEAAQAIYKQQQEQAKARAQEEAKLALSNKIDSDVAAFIEKNPEVDLAVISSMLTPSDVNTLTQMSGNYAENAYKLVQGKVEKLGIKPVEAEQETKEEQPDALFGALSTYRKSLSRT